MTFEPLQRDRRVAMEDVVRLDSKIAELEKWCNVLATSRATL